MVINNHTMNFCRSKDNISRIVGTSLLQNIYKLTFFAVIATKPVEIVFEKKIDKIEEINRNYVMP